jgi:hypothetical protein
MVIAVKIDIDPEHPAFCGQCKFIALRGKAPICAAFNEKLLEDRQDYSEIGWSPNYKKFIRLIECVSSELWPEGVMP